MNNTQTQFLRECSGRYLHDLTADILPFWLRYGADGKNGGVYTCIDRNGTLMDSTKSVWFQGRCAYIYAHAYRCVEQNPAWLDFARSCIQFIEQHCIDHDGHMFFSVTATGEPVQKRRYLFSECFAIMAMAEYAKASGEQSYAYRAKELYDNMMRMAQTPGFLPPKSYTPSRGHSFTMMLINVASILRSALPDTVFDRRIEQSVDELRRYFIKPQFRALLEMVGPNGEFIDTCAGRTINPGHGIETAWFILNEAKRRGWDKEYSSTGLQILDYCWEWGWDEEYGGIINFRDCKNFPPQDYSQDMKFWWPQCEAIIATLYAYQATGNDKYLAMHQMAHNFAFSNFPDPQCGEWYGYLHRDGCVAQPAKGNLFKGPFHIPRMMMTAHTLCNEILKS